VKCTANLILYPPRRYKPSELSLKGAFFLPAGFDKQRPVVFDFSPTAEDLEKILAGEIQIIVYGKLEYKDFRRERKPTYMFSGVCEPKSGKFQQYDDYNKETRIKAINS